MCYVRNDGNIVIEIKQLIFKRAGKPSEWCATRQVDKLNNENFFFPGTVYVPGCLCNAF